VLALLPCLAGGAWRTPVAQAQATVPRRAPSPTEEAAFAAGERALAAGDAATAERAFTEGYAVARDPAFLVKMGEAQEKRGAADTAAATYRRYVAQVPEAADADEIRARAERLAPTVAPTETAAAPAVASPPVPAADKPRATQIMELGDLRPDVAAGEDQRSALNVAAWIGAGTTVALLGVAAFYGAQAGSKKDDVNRYQAFTDEKGHPLEYATVAASYESAVRDGQHDDRVAKAFLWSAAATGAITIGLFVADALRAPEEPTVRRAATRDGWRWAVAPTRDPAGAGGLAASLSLVLP